MPCTSIKASLIDYLDGKPPEYKRALAFFTNWDVNAGTNLLGLPTFESYQLVFRSMDKRGIDVGRPAWKTPPWRHVDDAQVLHPHPHGHLGPQRLQRYRRRRAVGGAAARLSVEHENHKPVKADDSGGEIQAISDTHRGQLQAKVHQTIEDWKAGNYAQFKMV